MKYAWNPDAIQPGDEKTYQEEFCEHLWKRCSGLLILSVNTANTIFGERQKYNIIQYGRNDADQQFVAVALTDVMR